MNTKTLCGLDNGTIIALAISACSAKNVQEIVKIGLICKNQDRPAFLLDRLRGLYRECVARKNQVKIASPVIAKIEKQTEYQNVSGISELHAQEM